MSTIVFDVDSFRTAFPEFASASVYPDDTLSLYFDAATTMISAEDSPGLMLTGDARSRALDLLTAHLVKVGTLAAAGQNPGFVHSATVDKVTVMKSAPPFKSGWQWWLCATPYGAQLWALLEVSSVGGLYIGGMPELSAFRRVGGGFY